MNPRRRAEELYRHIGAEWTDVVALERSTGWTYGQVQCGIQRLVDHGNIDEEARGGRVRRVEGKDPPRRRIEGYPAGGFPEYNRVAGVICPLKRFELLPDVFWFLERQ